MHPAPTGCAGKMRLFAEYPQKCAAYAKTCKNMRAYESVCISCRVRACNCRFGMIWVVNYPKVAKSDRRGSTRRRPKRRNTGLGAGRRGCIRMHFGRRTLGAPPGAGVAESVKGASKRHRAAAHGRATARGISTGIRSSLCLQGGDDLGCHVGGNGIVAGNGVIKPAAPLRHGAECDGVVR